MQDVKQTEYTVPDFIDPNNPPETGPIETPKALPAPEEKPQPDNTGLGLLAVMAQVGGQQEPYSAEKHGNRIFTVEYYDREPQTFKARDYAKHYRNQSFREDSRAASDLAGMVERIELVKVEADKLLNRAPSENADFIKAKFNHFAKRHTEFSLAYIAANSNMASAMVTGPSNFPVRRQQKLMRQHHTKWEKLRDHMQIGIKSVSRAAFPHGDPKNGIRSDNPEAIDLLERKIAKLEENQEYYKKANRDVKAAMKFADPVAVMVGKGYSEEQAREYTTYKYSWMRTRTFESFVTSNNLANIKRLKGRLAALKRAKAAETQNQQYELENGETFELVRNSDAMRIQLLFDGKPSGLTRAALKSKGFRWAPSQSAWQRHLNNNGEYALKHLIAELEAKESEGA